MHLDCRMPELPAQRMIEDAGIHRQGLIDCTVHAHVNRLFGKDDLNIVYMT